VRLPADYVRQHVRLGYAATEHGNQSDTVTIGAELVTPATTRRGLYVGVTRGEKQNLILVVTEDGDLDQARDILEGVLASDWVDVPATTQRRELAASDRAPGRHRPTAQPRCDTPSWFEPLQARVRDELRAADEQAATDARRIPELQAKLAAAEQRRQEASQALAPHQPARSAASAAVGAAGEQWLAANNRERQSKGLHRRSARRDVAAAKGMLDAAVAQQDQVELFARPAVLAHAKAAQDVHDIKQNITSTHYLLEWSDLAGQADRLRDVDEALTDWRRWAKGQRIPTDRLASMVETLGEHDGHDAQFCNALADVLVSWGRGVGVDLSPTTPEIQAPSFEIEIDL
jgi:hypothetical protein